MNQGTKSGLQAWIRNNLGMTYTDWKRQNREVRGVQYNKYQRGVKLNPLAPLPVVAAIDTGEAEDEVLA